MTSNFQLTKHPVGSLREIWTMSWPLMLSLVSNSLMLFVDRLLLSWHSPLALAAGANASMAYYLFLVVPMAICAISEVFVGRLHGEGKTQEIGKPVWQTVWFAFMLAVPLWLISAYLPDIVFYRTGNQENEVIYFQMLMGFSPLMCASIAFSGFFIGIGKVKVVTWCTVCANCLNAVGGYLLIFGWGPIPALGVVGAGLATGLAQSLQMVLLLLCFLSKRNRKKYGTSDFAFHRTYFKDALRIGAPAGTGHLVEIFAHFIFFRIVMMAGPQHMAIAAIVQSFYLLFGFIVDAQSKGVGAIVANLIGAKEFGLISKVFKAAILQHTLFSIALLGLIVTFLDLFLGSFFSGDGANWLEDPILYQMASQAMLWMCLFFLFDGFCWILIGNLTASGDTKFIFYVSSLVNWVAYVLPVFLLVGLGGHGADAAWMIIAFYSMINFGIYFWRYRSGRWLQYTSFGRSSSGLEAVLPVENR
ncbi:MAG TPA: MATE family efflux transporter [Parachlamydiaceae bacterium]|nr:MATE family efflux transporter [Parachlamydiaceae bacterium]